MKIALVSYQYPKTGKGGIANIAYNLYHGLKRRNEVDLFCNKDHKEGIKIFEDYKKMKGATYINALRIIRYRHDYDWVIATEEIAAFPAFFLAKVSGAKLAILGHGTAMTTMDRQPYKKFLFNRVLKGTDLFIANSNFTKDRLKGFTQPKEAIVIHPGVDSKKFNTKKSMKKKLRLTGKKIIFTSGALVPGRKQEMFFDIMPKLIKNHPNLVYVLAGEGRKREEMEKRAKELGIDKQVIFLGHISQGIEKYYAMCDIYVCIDEWHKELGPESFGISLIEAAAAGKPVLTIDNGGGNKEAVSDGHTGFVCKDINEMYSKVDYLLSHPKKMKAMGRLGAYRSSLLFDWKSVIEQYELLLRYGVLRWL